MLNRGDIDRVDAFKLCLQYLGSAWKDVDIESFTVTKFDGGLSNRLFICAVTPNVVPRPSPHKVLLRLYGGSHVSSAFDSSSYISPARDVVKQTVVFIELANRDLGPKLYGAFPEGRLEEYIESHQITNQELENREVTAVIARKLARIHSVCMPIKKQGGGIVPLKNFFERCSTLKPEVEDSFEHDVHKEQFRQLMAFDLKSELDWIYANYMEVNSKIVFCLNDMNRQNIIVKEDETLNWNDRIFLIDTEYATYSPRAKDITSHFVMRTIDYNSKDIPYSGVNYPTELERREFLSHYLSHLDSRDHVLDTDEHLWMECEFFSLGASLSVILQTLGLFLKTKPKLLSVALDYAKKYNSDKKRFLQVYKNFN